MIDRVGESFISNEGYETVIVFCRNAKDCDVKFKNGYVSTSLTYDNIKKGKVKNPYHTSVYGVGYISVGEYSPSIDGRDTKAYIKWRDMLKRCYSSVYHEKQPTYKGCTVDKSWHNFQVFAKWYSDNYIEGFHLDKDILLKGNKIYSPETCCFVPQEVNNKHKNNAKINDK